MSSSIRVLVLLSTHSQEDTLVYSIYVTERQMINDINYYASSTPKDDINTIPTTHCVIIAALLNGLLCNDNRILRRASFLSFISVDVIFSKRDDLG